MLELYLQKASDVCLGVEDYSGEQVTGKVFIYSFLCEAGVCTCHVFIVAEKLEAYQTIPAFHIYDCS